MPAQPGYGRQFDKTHAVTVTAQAAIVKNRFVAFNGEHAAQLPTTGAGDCQGVSEESAALGEAVSLVTGYSYLVEASATIAMAARRSTSPSTRYNANGNSRKATCITRKLAIPARNMPA